MTSAYDEAVRLLSRRPLSRREVADRLRARGHDPEEIDAAIDRLAASGAVDDAALARHWIATTVRARGRGRARALAELEARGIGAEIAEAAWREEAEDGSMDERETLARAIRRRLGPPPGRANEGRLVRVYNALLSEGFEREAVEAALGPYGFERTDP